MASGGGGEPRVQSCFVECSEGPPVTTKPHPNRADEPIGTWLRHWKYSQCFVPVYEDGPDSSWYYCAQCREWRKVSTSTGHIGSHFQSMSHNDAAFQQIHEYSRAVGEQLCKSVVLFLLENGLPFRLIDDKRLATIPHLPGRKKLRTLSQLMAQNVRNTMKSLLGQADYCTLSMDEWSDIMKDRYLGITCHTTVHGKLKTFTLAHTSLNAAIEGDGRDSIVATDIANIVECVLDEYSISEKVILIVTDGAAVMKAAVSVLNDRRVAGGKHPIMWGYCVCHAINLLLGRFVKLISRPVRDVISLRDEVMTSEVFSARARRDSRTITRIPSYVEVRWYSLFELFKGMLELKGIIQQYYNDKGRMVSEEIWDTIQQMLPLLETIRDVLKSLESEDYGTICAVLMGFHMIKEEVMALQKYERYNEAVTQWLEFYKEIVGNVKRVWSPFLEVACFLNPGLDHSEYLTISDRERTREYIEQPRDWLNMTLKSAVVQVSESRVRKRQTVKTFYNTHIGSGRVSVTTVTEQEASRPKKTSPLRELMKKTGQQSERQHNSNTTVYDEFNLYTGLMCSGADPEEFWEQNAERLPHLGGIAQHIMAIIPSSASTERIFSSSKRIQGLRRAHMRREVFEDQIIICSNEELAEAAYDFAMVDYQHEDDEDGGQ